MDPAADADRKVTLIRWHERLANRLAVVEDVALVLLLALLIALAFGQIALRQLQLSTTWSDPVTRLLVLWVGVTGAVAASRMNEHINVDALSRFLPLRIQQGVAMTMFVFASGVCAVLAFHAVRFVLLELESVTSAGNVVPDWVLALVLPIGFTLIALRYALLAVGKLRGLMTREAS